MSRYDEIRLRGNPVAAFAVLRNRNEEPPPARELSLGERLSRQETSEAEAARRTRVQRVRERRSSYRSDTEFFAALRRAQDGTEEIEETGGGE